VIRMLLGTRRPTRMRNASCTMPTAASPHRVRELRYDGLAQPSLRTGGPALGQGLLVGPSGVPPSNRRSNCSADFARGLQKFVFRRPSPLAASPWSPRRGRGTGALFQWPWISTAPASLEHLFGHLEAGSQGLANRVANVPNPAAGTHAGRLRAAPREDLQMRKMLADQFRGFSPKPRRRRWRARRLRRSRRARNAAIPSGTRRHRKTRLPKRRRKVDLSLIGFERREGDFPWRPGFDRPIWSEERPKTRDDHPWGTAPPAYRTADRPAPFFLKHGRRAASAAAGSKIIDPVTTNTSSSAISVSMMPSVAPEPEQHETQTSPARRQTEGQAAAGPR